MTDLGAVLRCPMGRNDADAATVGGFLTALLSALWSEGEGFSGKRPLGNSDWQYQVYEALVKNDLVEGHLDCEGYLDEFSYDAEHKANKLILQVIPHLLRKEFEVDPEEAVNTVPQQRFYVTASRSDYFGENFDTIEEALAAVNKLAQQGWGLVSLRDNEFGDW